MAKQKFSISDIMNSASMGEAVTIDAAGRDRDIPLDLIDPSPANHYSMDRIEELAAGIEMVGLEHRIRVRSKPNGRYEILSGHRRYEAFRILAQDNAEKWGAIPSTVINSVDDAQAELQLILANSTSRVLTDADKVYQAERLKELLTDLKRTGFKFGGRMREYMANLLGTSATNIERYEGISANLSADWRKELDARKIGISLAHELSRKSSELQALIYTYYLEHPGIDQKYMIRDFMLGEAPAQVKPTAPAKEEQAAPPAQIIEEQAMLEVIERHNSLPDEQPPSTRRQTPEPEPSPIVAEGMEHGLRSGAQIEATRPNGPVLIHLVTAIYRQMQDGAEVVFADYGSGQKKLMRVVEVRNG